ncbi:MAG: hypothetical protein AAB454_01505 [Patescibacteria group bacterium]
MRLLGIILLLENGKSLLVSELRMHKEAKMKKSHEQSIQDLFEKAANRAGLYLTCRPNSPENLTAKRQKTRKPNIKEIFLQQLKRAGLNPIRLGADILKKEKKGHKERQMSIEEMFDQAIRRVGLCPVVVNNSSGKLVESTKTSSCGKKRKTTKNGRKTKH